MASNEEEIALNSSSSKDDAQVDVYNTSEDITRTQQFIYWRNRSLAWVFWATVFLVLLGLPWEFIKLHQKVAARRELTLVQGVPIKCTPQQTTAFERFMDFWISNTNTCDDYYDALHVIPFVEVTPFMVLSSVLISFLLLPLELACTSLGRCLFLCYSELPFVLQLVVFVGCLSYVACKIYLFYKKCTK